MWIIKTVIILLAVGTHHAGLILMNRMVTNVDVTKCLKKMKMTCVSVLWNVPSIHVPMRILFARQGYIFDSFPVYFREYFIPLRKPWHIQMAISVHAMKELFLILFCGQSQWVIAWGLFEQKKGFRGDGKNVCYDINECRERTHNCERRNGICTNKKGTFACSCDFGYAGDGYHCIDHDECEAGDHLCPGPSSWVQTLPETLMNFRHDSTLSWGILFEQWWRLFLSMYSDSLWQLWNL